MKKRTIISVLIAEFAVLRVLQLLLNDPAQSLFSLASFPFSLMGVLLGKTAARGAIGNGIALLIICAISLTPILLAVLRYGKKDDRPVGIALCVTGVLFAVLLPLLSNDALIADRMPLYDASLLSSVKTGICLTLWSSIVCVAVLRLLNLFHKADKTQLYSYTQRILYVLCALFTGILSVSLSGNMLSQLQQTTQTADRSMVILQFTANAVNYLFDICIALTAADLFAQPQTETITVASEKLCRRCTVALACMVGINTAINALHILLLPKTASFSVSLSLPILNIAFVLFVFLLARLIVENRKLHDDNDLFI